MPYLVESAPFTPWPVFRRPRLNVRVGPHGYIANQ